MLGLQDVYDPTWVERTLESWVWGKYAGMLNVLAFTFLRTLWKKESMFQLCSANNKIDDSGVPETIRALQRKHHSIPGLST